MEKARYWDYDSNNSKIPRECFKSSTLMMKFVCNECDSHYHTTLCNVTKGHWRPCVHKKIEKKCSKYDHILYANSSKYIGV